MWFGFFRVELQVPRAWQKLWVWLGTAAELGGRAAGPGPASSLPLDEAEHGASRAGAVTRNCCCLVGENHPSTKHNPRPRGESAAWGSCPLRVPTWGAASLWGGQAPKIHRVFPAPHISVALCFAPCLLLVSPLAASSSDGLGFAFGKIL